jgi:hypothetical protein
VIGLLQAPSSDNAGNLPVSMSDLGAKLLVGACKKPSAEEI